MCLDTVYSNRKLKKWLKTQPERITGFKVCYNEEVGFSGDKKIKMTPSPVIIGYKNFGIKNTSCTKTKKVLCCQQFILFTKMYIPYFHIFTTYKDAMEWMEDKHLYYPYFDILSCKINKKDVTSIGKQNDKLVIIAKEFEFINTFLLSKKIASVQNF